MDTAQQWCQDCVDDVVECPHWEIICICKRDHFFSGYWLLQCNLCMYALCVLLLIIYPKFFVFTLSAWLYVRMHGLGLNYC